MLKSPSPSRASLVRHSLYKLNRIVDKQHPCRTPLPVCTLLVSTRSSRTLSFYSMYSLLINLLSRQSMPILFRICINLVQFTRSNAFCQSMKQTHNSSSTSKVRSANYSHHPGCIPSSFSSSKSKTDLLQALPQFSFQSFF